MVMVVYQGMEREELPMHINNRQPPSRITRSGIHTYESLLHYPVCLFIRHFSPLKAKLLWPSPNSVFITPDESSPVPVVFVVAYGETAAPLCTVVDLYRGQRHPCFQLHTICINATNPIFIWRLKN